MPDTSIRRVHARRVWDSRGRPTVEVEITTGNGAMGRAIAPAGASMGSGEAVDRRDGGSAFGGLDVQDALRAIRTEIAPAVAGMDAADQAGVDGRLIQLDGTPNKSRLGGNATIAVSMAAAHATAAAHDMPLWRWLAGSAADGPVVMPLPEIQIFGGGAHADARVDLQDFMVVCPGAASFAQALDWTAEVYRAAGALMAADGRRQGVADEGGWWPVFADNEEAIATLARAIEKAGFQPGEEVAIALDVAASQFGRDGAYRLRLDERDYGRDEWAERVAGWVDRHPIVSVEDPMGEDDPAGMAAVTAAIGDRALVVGDDFLVTSAQRIQTAAADRACNAALIKPNQAGTLTETKAAFDAARAAGMRTIVSARSGETEDVTVVHLAVGWQADQLKVGSFARSERMAKWNEALRIEEALGERARFRAARIFPQDRLTDMAANLLHDLDLILAALAARGRLVRVRSEVDPVHELAGIAARFEGGPRAVLFERVKGHRWPVVTGLYWSRDLLADLLGQPERGLPQHVSNCIRAWQQRPVDPVVVATGPVLEVTEPAVDLAALPIPTHAEKDGGAYFDAAVVIARDPDTGVRNASIQRFMVTGPDTMTINIDSGRHLELYLEKARARGESLFFTLNCGVGPGLHFAAATPAEAAPADTDELGIASAFHGAPLELVAGTVSPVEMVAHAMIALECEMIPGEVADEGPFAEVTGYYARRAPRPVVHVRRIHRRHRPVFQTILSGKEVWNSVGLLGEANVLSLLQRQVPGVTDVYFTHGGCGFYHAVVALRQKRAGWGKQAIMAAFAAFPPLKMVTVVDDDVDIRSASDVEWAMATRMDPASGILVIDRVFGHGLNPGFPDYIGSKVGFDACRPFPFRYEHDRAFFAAADPALHDIAVPEIAP